MAFFNNFKTLCDERGTSPNAVGKIIGVSSGTITNWKRGTTPQSDSVQKIADYFDVPTDYLFTGTDKKTAPAPTEAESDDLKKVIIARSPEPLADEDAETLMKLLDSTVDSTIAAFLEARKNGRKAKRK